MSSKPSRELLDQWHENPDNWFLGVFYFNKADKRIFPPKKMKAMGWTVNFANPVSIAFLVVLIVAATLIILR